MTSPTESMTCPNCATDSPGRFCPECGQDNRHPRLSLRPVLAVAFQNLAGWDSALGRTLGGLTRAPGVTVADYVDGRRRRYVNPARFALISLALWFLVTKLFGFDVMGASGIRITNSSGGVENEVDEIREFLGRNLQILLYLALPLRALAFRLLFRGAGRNFTECLVLVLFVAGFEYLVRLIVTPLCLIDQEAFVRLAMAISFIWSIRAARSFFGQTWWGAIWRMICVSSLHLIGTMIFFAAVAIPWVLWFKG